MNFMSNESRSYNQFCPLARAMDILGERWTLLIVRELLSGPKRFKDLQDGMQGVGANLLSTRLKDMEANGLVFKYKLPPPGVAAVYELTEKGKELDSVVLSLIRWGIPLLATPKKETEYFLPHWLLHGMLGSFNKKLSQGIDESYEFHVEDEVFFTQVKNEEASGGMGKCYNPNLIWVSSSDAFMRLVFRITTPEDAMEDKLVHKGDIHVLRRVLSLFDPIPLTNRNL